MRQRVGLPDELTVAEFDDEDEDDGDEEEEEEVWVQVVLLEKPFCCCG